MRVLRGRACANRSVAGRRTVLRAIRGVLRPDRGAAVGSDRDVPAPNVLEVPLPARLRAVVRTGDRLDHSVRLLRSLVAQRPLPPAKPSHKLVLTSRPSVI